jgi:hypothetical protein
MPRSMHQASTVAHGLVGAATAQGRGHRARQQTRKDGMGDDGQGERYKEPAAGQIGNSSWNLRAFLMGCRPPAEARPVPGRL